MLRHELQMLRKGMIFSITFVGDWKAIWDWFQIDTAAFSHRRFDFKLVNEINKLKEQN